jgi:hypothetical protein
MLLRRTKIVLAYCIAAAGFLFFADKWFSAMELKAFHKTRDISCASGMKGIAQSVLMYAEDYDGKMPLLYTPEKQGGRHGWAEWLLSSGKVSDNSLRCPASVTKQNADGSYNHADDAEKRGYTDYWLNRRLSGKSVSSVTDSEILLGEAGDIEVYNDANFSLLPEEPHCKTIDSCLRHKNGTPHLNRILMNGSLSWEQ